MEALTPYTLGRDIEEFILSEEAIIQSRLYLLLGHARVDRCSTYPPSTQVIYLILHKRYEGRDDKRQPWEYEPWHLEGDALSPPSRHKT